MDKAPLNVYNININLTLSFSHNSYFYSMGDVSLTRLNPGELLINTIWVEPSDHEWIKTVVDYCGQEFLTNVGTACLHPEDHDSTVGFVALHKSILDGRWNRVCRSCSKTMPACNFSTLEDHTLEPRQVAGLLDNCVDCSLKTNVFGSYCSSFTFKGHKNEDNVVWVYHKNLKPSLKTKRALFVVNDNEKVIK